MFNKSAATLGTEQLREGLLPWCWLCIENNKVCCFDVRCMPTVAYVLTSRSTLRWPPSLHSLEAEKCELVHETPPLHVCYEYSYNFISIINV